MWREGAAFEVLLDVSETNSKRGKEAFTWVSLEECG